MVLSNTTSAFRSSVLFTRKLGSLLGQLALSLTFWQLMQEPSTAQLSPLPDEGLMEESTEPADVPPADQPELSTDLEGEVIDDASSIPTVEALDLRPDLDDVVPLILQDSALDETGREFEQYRLGPGDSIFVSVQRFPDLAFQATLDQQGNVIVPIEGAVRLEGLTLNEAENRIRAVYNRYVVIAEVESLGLVNRLDGLSYLDAERSIDNRIARVAQEIGRDIASGRLPSDDGIPANPNYQDIRRFFPDIFQVPDVTLTLVAQRGVEVIMVGEIERPGLYPLAAPRLTAALLAAGGARDTADLREIRIQRRLRDGSVIEKTVDLYTPVREGTPLPEERLENGDIVVLPRLDPAQAQDYDVNFVSRSTLAQPEILVRVVNYPQGAVAGQRLPNGSTFADALVGDSVRGGNGIGLPLNQANLRSVALIRFDPEQGEAVVTKLNAKDAIFGDPTQNPPLRDNDVIVVGRNLINRITFAIDTITQPFQDVLSFVLFFDSIFDSDLF